MCLLAAKLATTYSKPSVDLHGLAALALQKFKTLLLEVGKNNASEFPLVYESVYRGIVSSEGFVRHDIHVEFGNAVYNDHHYHYGYFITGMKIYQLYIYIYIYLY
jgi:endoglucanase Acf2